MSGAQRHLLGERGEVLFMPVAPDSHGALQIWSLGEIRSPGRLFSRPV